VIHPFLYGLFYLLAAYNRFVEVESIDALFLPALILTAGIGAAFIFIRHLTRDRLLAGLLLTVILCPILFYGDIQSLLYQFLPVSLHGIRVVILIIVVIAGTVTWLILKYGRRNLLRLTRAFNALTACLFAAVLLQTAWVSMGMSHTKGLKEDYWSRDLAELAGKERSAHTVSELPDVYYIVLDSYTSDESLLRYWKYNNSGFTGWLRSKGFEVAGKARCEGRSPIPATSYCVACRLNLSELPEDLPMTKLSQMISDSFLPSFLRKQGYETVNLSFTRITDQQRFYGFNPGNTTYADFVYSNSLPGYVLNMVYFLYVKLPAVNREVMDRLKSVPHHPAGHPKFVYAHLMMPHPPYVYNRDGSRKSFLQALAIHAGNQEAYLEQLIHTNRIVVDGLQHLIDKSGNRAVIILQGDHGFRYLYGPDLEKEGHSILSAYRFPGGNSPPKFDNESPQNVFRAFLNIYFRANLGYRP